MVSHSNKFNRREFLLQTAIGSAALLTSGTSRGSTKEATHEDAQVSTWQEAAREATQQNLTPFDSLAPGAIRPQGWLQLYLEKQAVNLGSQLPNVSWPFTAAYWQGEEKAESWWPWEQKAYWVDGAARLALVLGDQKLLAQVDGPLRYTLDHADRSGYLGPAFFKDPEGDYHRWPQTVFFRALVACCDAGLYPEAVEALRRHYLNDRASYARPSRNITNIEIMLWCYERTEDKRLLDQAENSWRNFLKVIKPGDNPIDLSALRVFSASPINMHGVNYIETAKQPALLYRSTRNTAYLEFALAAQRRVLDHHMLIDGVPSTSEYYRTRTSLDSHETCCIADHSWTWGYMLMVTGEAAWADRIERACFNGGFGAIKKDWRALQYFSCPNQFLATQNSDHNVLFWSEIRSQDGGAKMAYQPNPGQATACCGGNVHRIFPNYVIRMWMKEGDGNLVAALYGPSCLKTTIGPQKQEVEIIEETDYPFGEQIDFTIRMRDPQQFSIALRIPEWCQSPSVFINNRPYPSPVVNKGFMRLHRQFKPEDKITLKLPMKLAVSEWPQNGIGIEHGPLVYSLPIRENWTPVVEPKYTTEEYPGWDATPASRWNYSLALDPAQLERQVHVHRKAMTPDPWVEPPITLTVPGRIEKNWELQQNPDNANQQFTPPLPDPATMDLEHATEEIKLSPYGSTHLRVTIFPGVRKS